MTPLDSNPDLLLSDSFTGKTQSPPVTINRGTSPILLINKHGSLEFSSGLHDSQGHPLGLDPAWLARAHEGSDLHINSLITHLRRLTPQLNVISFNRSRLEVDVDRTPAAAITTESCEKSALKIPGNLNLTTEQTEARLRLYHEFYDRLADEMARIIKIHGFVIPVDLHSFTPHFNDDPRDKIIGTIRRRPSALSRRIEDTFAARLGEDFKTDYPYKLHDRKINASHMFEKRFGIPYFGIEIRNDAIAGQHGIEDVGNLLFVALDKALHDAEVTRPLIQTPAEAAGTFWDKVRKAFETFGEPAPQQAVA